MNMNIQSLMKEAQKMQKDLQKAQKELENTEYEGESSFVKVILDGNKNMKSIHIECEENFSSKEDIEMLEDMIVLAFQDASKKVEKARDSKLGKYGAGLSGLM